jgi:NAD(P)-dependent dehydrogenase (short-subunit alcohol dehydrogenase family)
MPEMVIVTGGSRGIGAECSLAFARRGWDVAIGYLNDDAAARKVTAAVEALGRSAIAYRTDVGREQGVLDLFTRAQGELGPVRAVVNNAGIVSPPSRLDEMKADRIAEMMRVNVIGTLLCAREAVRNMSTRHGGAGGSIVNVSSGATRFGSPGEYVDYAASKGAIEVFTIGLAKEVGPEGIRVNAVRPGVIVTDIHTRGGQPDKPQRLAASVPLGRAGRPEEVAAAIQWLCTDEASYVNGAILDVTGGR